jgi:hypothetical protein
MLEVRGLVFRKAMADYVVNMSHVHSRNLVYCGIDARYRALEWVRSESCR